MDFSVIPDIFALTVFILGFRPLVRRAGSHVNLWFLGWTFLLLHAVAIFISPSGGLVHRASDLAALWTLDLCGLSFMLAAGNSRKRNIDIVATCLLGAPVLFQAALGVLEVHVAALAFAACACFIAPAVYLLAKPVVRGRGLAVVGVAFAAFGIGMLPVALRYPAMMANAALSLLFVSAGYLYFITSVKFTRGAVAAMLGLASWGLSYPVVALYMHFHHGAHLDRGLLDLPQYLVVGGIILTLLDEHVSRTERMAMHDPLTDLPNRRLFEERLIATMEEARVNCTTIACLVIDVDNFKLVNDTLGHTAGDQLLRALAVRLSWHMSPRDILARTGGDEFTALLAGVRDENHLRFIASAMMSAASVPIAIDGRPVDVGISIGIALSPDHADDIDSLRRAADEAMYSAKRRGGSLLAFAGEE